MIPSAVCPWACFFFFPSHRSVSRSNLFSSYLFPFLPRDAYRLTEMGLPIVLLFCFFIAVKAEAYSEANAVLR